MSKRSLLFYSYFFLIFTLWVSGCQFPILQEQEQKDSQLITVTFLKPVDGDTAWFLINGKEEKVRFLGIDTPETVDSNSAVEVYGQEASDYTKDRLQHGDEIQLEYEEESDKKDKYGRVLAWVWVDGSLLQTELLEKGFAKIAYISGDYKYLNELQKMEEKALEKKVGIWDETFLVVPDAK